MSSDINTVLPANDTADSEFLANCKSSAIKFMEVFLHMILNPNNQHLNNMSQYFHVLYNFARFGVREREFLSRKSIVRLLLDYFMGASMHTRTDLKNFYKTLSICVLSCGKLPPTATAGDEEYFPLSEQTLLFNEDVMFQLFRKMNLGDVTSATNIVIHLAFEDQERSHWILEILMELISRAGWDQCDNYFSCLESMLGIQDSLTIWRTEVTLSQTSNGLMKVIHIYQSRYPTFSLTCLKFISGLFSRFPNVAAYMYYAKNQWWTWVQKFLKNAKYGQFAAFDVGSILQTCNDFVDGNLELQIEYKKTWIPQYSNKRFDVLKCKLY